MEAKTEKKLKKVLPPEWVDGIETVDDAILRDSIAKSAIAVEEINEAEKADEDIIRLRADMDNARTSYRESRRIENAKIKYCRNLLKDRGKL